MNFRDVALRSLLFASLPLPWERLANVYSVPPGNYTEFAKAFDTLEAEGLATRTTVDGVDLWRLARAVNPSDFKV